MPATTSASSSYAEADYAALPAGREAGRAVATRASLDDEFTVKERDRRASVRRVHAHMIEEHARRDGHADLLRERIHGGHRLVTGP